MTGLAFLLAWAVLLLVGLLPALALGFLLFALYTRGWRWLAPLVLVAVVLDVLANYTTLALLTWDWPRAGERTFSQRLYRLVQDPRRWGCLGVARVLNALVPGHIKITRSI